MAKKRTRKRKKYMPTKSSIAKANKAVKRKEEEVQVEVIEQEPLPQHPESFVFLDNTSKLPVSHLTEIEERVF